MFLEIHAPSLDLGTLVSDLFVSNDLRRQHPEKEKRLRICLEADLSRREPVSCAGKARAIGAGLHGVCFFHQGRYHEFGTGSLAYRLEFDPRRHQLDFSLNEPYVAQPLMVCSILLRNLFKSFILPFYGMKAIHGSVLTRGNKTVMFVGPSSAGKSTVALALALDGFDLLADDFPLFTRLENTTMALCSLDYVNITPTTLSMFPSLQRLAVGGLDHEGKHCLARRAELAVTPACRIPRRVDYILRLNRGPTPRARLRRTRRGALLPELLAGNMRLLRPDCAPEPALAKAYNDFNLEVIDGLVADAEFLQLEYADGDLPRLANLIKEDLAPDGA